MDLYNTPQVAQAGEASRQASSTASQAATSATTLPDMLRDALSKKLGTDNPLYQQREGALKNYLNESTQAPLDYTAKSAGGNSDVIYSPLQQSNLIQGRRSAAIAPITTLNDLLGLEYGGLNDVIDSTSRAANAHVAGLQEDAKMKRQDYTDIIDLIGKQADENYRQKELSMKGSGGSDFGDFASILASIMGGGGGSGRVPTEPKPKIPSMKMNSNTLYHSPEGQWVYDAQGGDWVPVTD